MGRRLARRTASPPASPVPASLGHVVARGCPGGRVFLGRGAAAAAGSFKPVEVEVHLDGTAFWHGPAAAPEVRNLALPGTAPQPAVLGVFVARFLGRLRRRPG